MKDLRARWVFTVGILYLLPEGRRSCKKWVGSDQILVAICSVLDLYNEALVSLLQVIPIFCVSTCQLLSYPLQGPHMQIDEVLTLVERETHIPIARQDLLLSSGMEVNRSKPAEKCIVDNLVSSGFLSR